MNLKQESILRGKNIILRDAVESDSEFILGLRTDPKKSEFLSPTPPSIDSQRQWMRHYRDKTDQAYFIIEDYSKNQLGCLRIYNPHQKIFEWGSWLIIDGTSSLVALESALLVYDYTRRLGFIKAKLEVRQLNINVWKFHEKVFGAKLIHENTLDKFYELDAPSIDSKIAQYKTLLIP